MNKKVSTTSFRLIQVMRERNLKQVDILQLCKPYCDISGVKIGRSDLSQYVNGKVLPGQEKLTILGKALGVSETWLMGYSDPETPTAQKPITTKRLPMLGYVSCGVPVFVDEERNFYVEVGVDLSADFCLRAKGDSMIGARILDGDLVFVRKQSTVDNGDIAVVVIEDDATLKRVVFLRDKGILILKPENPKYDDIVYTGQELNSIHILGKAVAFQSDVQ